MQIEDNSDILINKAVHADFKYDYATFKLCCGNLEVIITGKPLEDSDFLIPFYTTYCEFLTA